MKTETELFDAYLVTTYGAMTAPASPTSPIAPPEMTLTVNRNQWPTVIAKTTGHLLAYGPPGTGKSWDFSAYAKVFTAAKLESINELRAEKGQPPIENLDHFEVNCTRQTSAAGWLGHWIDGGPDGFKWNDGPVARAMKLGVPIVINDIHLCSDDLFDLLFFVLDDPERAVYSLPTGEQLRATTGFRAFMSMNGDPIQVLDEPIRDRVQARMPITVPSDGAIKSLDRDVRRICRVVYEAAEGKGDPRFTYRTFKWFCTLRRELGDPFMAAALACEDKESARAFLEPLLVK